MYKTLLLVAAASAVASLSELKAQSVTDGNALLSLLKASERFSERGDAADRDSAYLVLGYISGIGNMALAVEVEGLKPAWRLPDKMKNEQLLMVVRKFLVEHPEKLHLPSVTLVIEAITEAFPAKQNHSSPP